MVCRPVNFRACGKERKACHSESIWKKLLSPSPDRRQRKSRDQNPNTPVLVKVTIAVMKTMTKCWGRRQVLLNTAEKGGGFIIHS